MNIPELFLQFNSQSQNASSKLAFMFSDVQMKILTNRYKAQSLKMKESLLTLNIGLGFNANNFLYSLTNEVIEKIFPMGIIQHWLEASIPSSYDLFRNKKSPKVLKIDDLSFGFVLWLTACAVSSLCFLVEVGYSKCGKLLSSSIGLILMLQILDNERCFRI